MFGENLIVFLLFLFPIGCEAFTWGDFHVFAVIFFTFLGSSLMLGALIGAFWFAFLKPFINRFQQEIAQTHREYHPWPPGSVRWKIQQMVKSGRKSAVGGVETNFSVPKMNPEEYLNVRGLPSTVEYFYKGAQDQEPIIRPSDYYRPQSQARSYTSGFDRPTYFTPSPEKALAPVREEIEEYRITREESCVSAASGSNVMIPSSQHGGDSSVGHMEGGARVIRNTTSTHTQKILLPNTYI